MVPFPVVPCFLTHGVVHEISSVRTLVTHCAYFSTEPWEVSLRLALHQQRHFVTPSLSKARVTCPCWISFSPTSSSLTSDVTVYFLLLNFLPTSSSQFFCVFGRFLNDSELLSPHSIQPPVVNHRGGFDFWYPLVHTIYPQASDTCNPFSAFHISRHDCS